MKFHKLPDEIINSMRRDNRNIGRMPEKDYFLSCLFGLMPITGQVKIMYCNSFLRESIQLLTNSIFLFEDGYFDCAFYSVRQAGELADNMLYIAKKEDGTLEKWSAKERFPMSGKLKEQLERLSCDYSEIKSLLPNYFEEYSQLIKKAHKIIHKQGFDTFYCIRNRIAGENKFPNDKEIRLFMDCLKYTIGMILILFIIIEPISLALADEEIDQRLNINFITEPIDVEFFNDQLQPYNIIEIIKKSDFYQKYILSFADLTPMSPAVYSVIRDEAWNLDALDEIEMQKDLLGAYERFMLDILRRGLKISIFYYLGGIAWYYTSIMSNYDRKVYGGDEFIKYKNSNQKFNQPCQNAFISVVKMFDETLFLEHNEPLSSAEISFLSFIEKRSIKEYNQYKEALDYLINKTKKEK